MSESCTIMWECKVTARLTRELHKDLVAVREKEQHLIQTHKVMESVNHLLSLVFFTIILHTM